MGEKNEEISFVAAAPIKVKKANLKFTYEDKGYVFAFLSLLEKNWKSFFFEDDKEMKEIQQIQALLQGMTTQ